MRYAAELAIARLAAEQAGQLIRERWGSAPGLRFKGEVDLVTEVDLAAEALLLKQLSQCFPEDEIIAEEGGGQQGDGSRRWYLDPLDGTTNFSHGFPQFCISIAFLVSGQVEVGVIYEPLRRWSFYAVRGEGAWRDGARLSVSQIPKLAQALLATGFPYDRRSNPDNNIDRAAAALLKCQGLRRAGSAALDLAFLAAGWLDGYWEDRLKPWDLAAGLLLVEEAGGQLSDLSGGPVKLMEGALLASNGQIHMELLQVLASKMPEKD